MQQWRFDHFTQFFNLFFASAHIAVRYVWFVFDLHHCDRWIDFRRQWYMNLILIPINTVFFCSIYTMKDNAKLFQFLREWKICKWKWIECSEHGTCTYPTRIPSSMSVGATESARSTTNFANCFTLIMYFGSSESALMIFVQRAT